MKGVLICVLAFGLLILVFTLLIGVVAMGIMGVFPKKEKSQRDELPQSDTDEDEAFDEDVDDTIDLMIMGVIEGSLNHITDGDR